MKSNIWKNLLVFFLTLFTIKIYSQTTVTYNSDGYFVVPVGVTSIIVECWGAGGGGGAATPANRSGGGGGGGGGYSIKDFAVNAGEVYPFVVGEGGNGGYYDGVSLIYSAGDGGNTYFINNTSLLANGGIKGGYGNGGVVGVGGAGGAVGVGTFGSV